MDYSKKVLLLILISSVLKIVFASSIELSADEAYYWTYALKLQWNYFDHPPMVALIIRIFSANLWFRNEVFIRLGAIVCSGISTWLIFKIGTFLKNQQTGWFAALLLTSSIYCSISSGANILPDSPELLFWLSSVLLLLKISKTKEGLENKSLSLWCLFGIMAGFCIMSKLTGVFIWIGALSYVFLIDRHWLKNKAFYIAALVTLIIISPIIIWNFQNDFITYKFHSNRIAFGEGGINITGFLKAIVGEAAINNPINFFLVCINLIFVAKGEITTDTKSNKILLYSSLPLIFLVLLISLFRETFSHWSSPAFTCLLVFPAANLASKLYVKPGFLPIVLKWCLGYMVFVGLSQYASINFFPGTLSTVKKGIKTGNEDLTLYMFGWDRAGFKFDSLYNSDVKNKLMPKDAPIIVTNWAPAATIEYYVTQKTGQAIVGIGNIADLHQYLITNNNKNPLKVGDNAYFIVPSDSFYFKTANIVFNSFKSYQTALIITQYRGGQVCRYITVFRLKGYIKS